MTTFIVNGPEKPMRCVRCGCECGTKEKGSINGYCQECWEIDQAPKLKTWLEEKHGFKFDDPEVPYKNEGAEFY